MLRSCVLGVVMLLNAEPLLCAAAEDSLLGQARREISNGNFPLAELALRSYSESHGETAYASYLMGVALAGERKWTESDEYLRKALKEDENLDVALRMLAMNAFEAHDFDRASKYLSLFLDKRPIDPLAHATAAQIALTERSCALAVDHFRKATSLVGGSPRLQLLLAQALMCSDQAQQAGSVLAGIRSKDASIVFQEALLLTHTGHLREALVRLKQVREVYPDRAAVQFNIALVHFQMQDYSDAIADLNQMTEAGLGDADVYSLLGDSYQHVGKEQEALQAFQRAISLAPGDLQPAVDLLSLYVDLKDTNRGLELANVALNQHPAAYELFALRAALLSLRNEPALAEADYRRALELSPNTEWLYTGLAALLMFDEHRPKDSEELLRSHLDEFTGYYSYFLYSEALRRLGLDRDIEMQRKSIECLKRSIHLNPMFAPARASLGRLYQVQGDWSRALLEYRKATELDPSDAGSYFHLYRIYTHQGDLPKAREMLASASRLNANERARRLTGNGQERTGGARGEALYVAQGHQSLHRE